MHCFIINLPHQHQRRHAITANLEQCDIDFSIIEAVDGRALSESDIEEKYDAKKAHSSFNRNLSRGEIGCALSHIKIYQKMVLENISSAMILEDDARIIDADIKKILAKLAVTYPSDCAVAVLLRGDGKYIANGDNIVLDKKHTLHDAYRGVGTSAYFITNAAATILAHHLFPVYVVADKWEYFQEKFFPVKLLVPHCVALTEASLASTIGDRDKKITRIINIGYYIKKHINTILFKLLKRPFIQIRKHKNPDDR